jgi:MFS family permease
VPRPRNELLGPLSEREFRLLFSARTISLLGTAIAPIALAFAVLDDLDGSPTQLGLVLAASWLPQVLLMLVGGVWADRVRRERLLVGTDLLMAGAQAAVAVLLLTHTAAVWHVAALQVLRGVAFAFFWPASTAIVPDTVNPQSLQQANALLRVSQTGLSTVGALAGGALVAGVGPGWAFAFDAATYLGSAAVLTRMSLPALPVAIGRDFVRELKEGWNEFWSRTWLWSIVIGAALGNMALLAGQTVLGPVVAKEHLGGPSAWGAIVAAESAGLLLGGLVLLRYRPQRILFVGCLTLIPGVPALAALALPAPLAVILVTMLLAGCGLEMFNVLWTVAIQQQIPRDRLARVNAYDALGSFVFIPIGLTLAGPLADAIGVAETIWAAAAVEVAVIVFMLAFSDVRTLRRTDAPVVVPAQPDAA